MRIVEQYLLQLNNEKRRLMRAAAILTALSFLVVIGVSWNLRITAITIANGATCGRQEHRHDAQCIAENVAVCDYEQAAVPVIMSFSSALVSATYNILISSSKFDIVYSSIICSYIGSTCSS